MRITPKEKAKSIICKMWDNTPNRKFEMPLIEENYLGMDDAISSAIVCVEEIFNNYQFFLPDTKADKYWKDVLTELNAL